MFCRVDEFCRVDVSCNGDVFCNGDVSCSDDVGEGDSSLTSGAPVISITMPRLRSPASANSSSTSSKNARTFLSSARASSTSSSCASSATCTPMSQRRATHSSNTSNGLLEAGTTTATRSIACVGCVDAVLTATISACASTRGAGGTDATLVSWVGMSWPGHIHSAAMAIPPARHSKYRTVDLCDPDGSRCCMNSLWR